MFNSLIENTRSSKFENVCFCGHPNIFLYIFSLSQILNIYLSNIIHFHILETFYMLLAYHSVKEEWKIPFPRLWFFLKGSFVEKYLIFSAILLDNCTSGPEGSVHNLGTTYREKIIEGECIFELILYQIIKLMI